MKKFFLLLFLSLSILNVFAVKKSKKKVLQSFGDQSDCVDEQLPLDEEFLCSDNFVFWLTDKGDINFYQKNSSGELREVDTKFKVSKLIEIENNEQREQGRDGKFCSKICVLAEDSSLHYIEIEAVNAGNGKIRFRFFVDRR